MRVLPAFPNPPNFMFLKRSNCLENEPLIHSAWHCIVAQYNSLEQIIHDVAWEKPFHAGAIMIIYASHSTPNQPILVCYGYSDKTTAELSVEAGW